MNKRRPRRSGKPTRYASTGRSTSGHANPHGWGSLTAEDVQPLQTQSRRGVRGRRPSRGGSGGRRRRRKSLFAHPLFWLVLLLTAAVAVSVVWVRENGLPAQVYKAFDSVSFDSESAEPRPGVRGQSPARPVATVTTNATATAPVWTDDATISEVERTIGTWINIERTIPRDGSYLQWDNDLASVARAHSEDMATRNYFDHDTPEGLDPTDRLHAAGLNCRKGNRYGIAENIAIETSLDNVDMAAFEAVRGWVGSPGHKRNLLNEEYDSTGVGAALGTWQGRKALYLTQVFC